eukprot:CAMPEP_0117508460 /NCGR_PEP_ID=MMETSP0784-20121206/26963_1 /TAXON_ID=39447 /ORGANISM="" /LENGTH=694 /DNA_ID=CAMNT_0005304021 /DNA_START=105 /DNA_END=2190 /DNA_ORIENTATION=+
MFSFGIVGDSNVGKSTLLNALLGDRILPSKRTCCTSVLTHCLLDGGALGDEGEGVTKGDPLLVEPSVLAGTPTLEIFSGASPVRARIDKLNGIVRTNSFAASSGNVALEDGERQGAEDPQVVDVLVHVGACKGLAPMVDARTKLVDVPGHDETDNPIARECKDVVLSLCHSLLVLVKHDKICSDATGKLLESLVEDAPHLFDAWGGENMGLAPVIFVITQVDQLDTCDLDGEDTDNDVDVVNDLKAQFRSFLRRRECLQSFPRLAESVPIFATGITKDVLAGRHASYDWDFLIAQMLSLHRYRDTLIESRKVLYSTRIYRPLRDALHQWTLQQEYPKLATDILSQHNQHKLVKVALASIGIGTLALGGWMACTAWVARGVALAEAVAASASASAAAATATCASEVAASATAAAATAGARAAAASATASYVSVVAASAGNTAAAVGTVAGSVATGDVVGGTLVGGVVGVTARGIAWLTLGGSSANKAAALATAAATSASMAAATATATATSASVAAATATATAAGAASAVTTASTSVAAYASLALAGGVAAMRSALIGEEVVITAPGLGCLGARRAVEAIITSTAKSIQNSRVQDGEPYEDYILWPGSEDRVLYVGQFKDKAPHGIGRLFWKDTQIESFVGEFELGHLKEGVFISNAKWQWEDFSSRQALVRALLRWQAFNLSACMTQQSLVQCV